MKEMLYKALEMVPSTEVVEEEAVRIYFASFELAFFTFATSELEKINLFYSEKLAEAIQKFSFLKHEVEGTAWQLLDKKKEAKKRRLENIKLAFSEFYLALILLHRRSTYQKRNLTNFRRKSGYLRTNWT